MKANLLKSEHSQALRIVGVIGLEPIQSETPDLQSGPALQLRRTPSQFCVPFPV